MQTIRVFYFIDEEMNYYGGAENFFSRYLPSIHQRIVNIRMNTYGMNEQQKNAFILGNRCYMGAVRITKAPKLF